MTISNEVAPSAGVHPTAGLHVRSNSKVAVRHLSWALILSEAVKEHAHRGVDDPEQAWLLNELIRYLSHPKSGVLELADMGDNWAMVRDAATSGTLNRSDPAAAETCQRWDHLMRVAALRLGTETGADVSEVISKAHRAAPQLRSKEFLRSLCDDGALSGILRVPASAGDMTVTADIKASIVEVSASFAAPPEGTPRAAVVWLVKQLRAAPRRSGSRHVREERPHRSVGNTRPAARRPSARFGRRPQQTARPVPGTVPNVGLYT